MTTQEVPLRVPEPKHTQACGGLGCKRASRAYPWKVSMRKRTRTLLTTGLIRIQTPPPSRPPEVFEPVFLQFEIFGETASAAGARIFGFWPLKGEFFSPDVSILKILRILWRIQKWVKNTKKI